MRPLCPCLRLIAAIATDTYKSKLHNRPNVVQNTSNYLNVLQHVQTQPQPITFNLQAQQCLTPLPLPAPAPPSSHADAPSPAPSPATESPETRREAPGMSFQPHPSLASSIPDTNLTSSTTGSAAAADKPTCPPIARTGARSTDTTSVRGAMFTSRRRRRVAF